MRNLDSILLRWRRLSVTIVSIGMAAGAFVSGTIQAGQAIRLIVDSGKTARQDCPITVALSDDVRELTRDWAMFEIRDSETVPTPRQFLGRKQTVLAWILAGNTPPETVRTFELRPLDDKRPPEKADAQGQFAVQRSDSSLEIRAGDRPVLRYLSARVEPPEGIDPKYGRSGYIHPVWTPNGEIVSDEFPPDHPHQDGIFLANTKTEFEGRQPDFWNLLGGTGFVRCAEALSHEEGPVCGGFRVRHEHVDAGVPGGKTALTETWDVRVWKSGSPDLGWRFDIASEISCATDSPLTVKEYHYGGMAFRGARSWTGDSAIFTLADGKTREAGNHSRTPWVDLSGTTGGKTSGITIFTDPNNFRFPEPVRLHPTMPYFVFTPAVLGDWVIEPGRSHLSRYHYHVHDGAFRQAEAEQIWADLADPPRVALRPLAK